MNLPDPFAKTSKGEVWGVEQDVVKIDALD